MNLPDRLTFIRIILTPVFFVVYLMHKLFPVQLADSQIWIVPLLWVIFITSEITDMLDGLAARRLKITTDFGKLFDPFADTLMQLTCFLCFVLDGIFPAALFLLVMYREFGILFIRNLMLKKGITMGARMGGKIKTVTYIASAGAALLYASLNRLNLLVFAQPLVKIAAIVIFGVSVLFSILSFIDYLSVYRASGKADKV